MSTSPDSSDRRWEDSSAIWRQTMRFSFGFGPYQLGLASIVMT